MAVKITIPVEFADSAQSYRQLINQLQKQLDTLKPGTGLYNGIKEQINKAREELKKIDTKLDIGVVTESELRKLTSGFSTISNLIKRINSSLQNIDIGDLADLSDAQLFSGDELTRVENYRKELIWLQQAAEKLAKTSIKDAGLKDLFSDSEKELPITQAYEQLNETLEEVSQKAADAKQALDAAIEAKNKAQSAVNVAQQESQKKGYLADDAAYRVAFGGADRLKQFDKSGKDIGDSIQSRLKTEFSKLIDDAGNWIDGGQSLAQQILEKMGLNANEAEHFVAASASDIFQLIDEEFNKKSGGLFVKTNIQGYIKGQSGYDDTKTRYAQFNELQRQLKQAESIFNDRKGEDEQAQKVLELIRNKVTELRSAMSVTLDDDTEHDLFERLQWVEKELQNLINQKRKEILPNGVSEAQRQSAETNVQLGAEAAKASAEIEHEVEDMQSSMKHAIKYWLSAEMIVTKIRDGISQAWQDIRGLDTAMTNIAVVTDMSVSDLWGRIDEYMAIAQEYGVTTQGVYEVSQLYYQQGLSTDEVMAATTETLKMARIAGMGYAEAADAMTVAIRAFKMEMSDAQVITDVYSKVAAVTASDSEELAIAMSKTASSAESVGSSFENTTAMLAVMIETTRESAQNLGSALKSIISRYGEMKVGLTVDSEGEEIDYNKVDTALKSIGISLKDAQGQFRDFDDVIFELSDAWDGLDKNTQRYIATIMAGNRQQSRFIALVDNAERLREVSQAAADSEDAGLLQYAKTLDSLDTKLNALSTSFQQFYMDFVNGDTFKYIIDLITGFLNGLNKLGKLDSIFSIASIYKTVKHMLSFVINNFSSSFAKILVNYKEMQKQLTTIANKESKKRAEVQTKNELQGQQQIIDGQDEPQPKSQEIENFLDQNLNLLNTKLGKKIDPKSNLGKALGNATVGGLIQFGEIAGGALNLAGITANAKGHAVAGSLLSGVGNTISGAATGAQLGASVGGLHGAVVGAVGGAVITGLTSLFTSVIPAWKNQLKEEINTLSSELSDLEIERATKKEEARNLESTLNNLKKLQQARYKSEEAEQAFIEASNSAAEQFPQLVKTYDEAGNAVIDVIQETASAEYILIAARKDAAAAALEAAQKAALLAQKQAKQAEKEAQGEAQTNNAFLTELENQIRTSLWNSLSVKDQNRFGSAAQAFKTNLPENATAIEIVDAFQSLISNGGYNWNYGKDSDFIKAAIEKNAAELVDNYYSTSFSTPDQFGSIEDWRKFILPTMEQGESVRATEFSKNANKDVIANYLANYLTGKDPLKEEAWRKVGGIETYLLDQLGDKYSSQLIEKDGKLQLKETDSLYGEANALVTNWEAFSEYLTNIGKVEDYQELYSSFEKGGISVQTFIKSLYSLFGEQIPENIQPVINYLKTSATTSSRESIDNFIKHLRTLTSLGEVMPTNLFGNLDRIPELYLNSITTLADTLNTQVENEIITKDQAQKVLSQVGSIWQGLLNYDGLSSEVLGQAQAAFGSTDFLSLSSVQELQEQLSELGIDINKIPAFKNFEYYSINLASEYDTLITKMNSGLEKMREILTKVGEGLSTEDATSLAKTLGTTLNDSNIFSFSDGKWFVKDLQVIYKAIEEKYNGLRQSLSEQLQSDLEILEKQNPDEAAGIKQNQLLDAYLENANKWALANQKEVADLSAEGGREKALTLIGQYLQATYSNITEAYNLEADWLKQQAQKSQIIRDYTNQLTGGSGASKDREIYDKIKATGYEGYTAQEASEIGAHILSWFPDKTDISELFQNMGDGTYRLLLNEEEVKRLPVDVQSAINQTVINQINNTISSLKDIGSVYTTKNAPKDYSKVFSNFFSTRDPIEATRQVEEAIAQALEGDLFALQNIINADMGGTADWDTLEYQAKLVVANIQDSTTEGTLRVLKLAEKFIEGTITEAELTELKQSTESGWSEDFTAILNDEGLSTLEKYQRIIAEAIEKGINWEEIKDTVSNTRMTSLRKLASGAEFKDEDTYDLIEDIREASGYYENDLLNTLFDQLKLETGKDITLDSNFKNYFEIDPETKNWIIKAGADINAYLGSVYGEELPKEIKAAFAYSETQKIINDAIRIDEAGRTITENVGEIFSNAAETSLDDLISLYETVHGEGAFTKSGLLDDYQNALQKAKQGNVTALSGFIESLVKEAQDKGIKVDTTLIQNTVQDAALALMAAIVETVQAGIGGTMTNTDYTQLLKDIGVNQFEPDGSISQDWERWQNMVYSTNEGLKFTKQGLLDIYGVVASRNAMASQGILEMIAEDYREYDNLSSTLAHIKELRDLKDKADPTKRKQYEQELEVAEKIAKIRSQDPDSFNFMDRAIPDEIQSPLNVWQNAADAASALQDAKTNGYMGAEDFYRIVTTASEYMAAAGQEFSVAGMTYEDLISKATSSLATANGNLVVDFSKFGIDFAGGIDDMASGLEDGLKALAEEQIEILDGMIAMLETMKTIQDINDTIDGSVDGKKNGLFDFTELFTVDDEGLAQWKDSTIEWWNTFQGVFGEITFNGLKIDEAWNKGLITATEVQSFMNQAKEIIANASADVDSMIDQLTAVAQTTFGEEFAIEFKANLSENLTFNPDGTVTYNNIPYKTKQEAVKAALDQMQLNQDSFDKQLIENATYGGHTSNWTIKTELIADTAYEVKVSEDGQYYFQGKLLTEDQFKEAVKKVAESQKPDTATTAGGEAATGEYLAGGAYEGIAYTIGNAIKINDSDTNYTSLEKWVLETFGNPEATTEAAAQTGTWLKGGHYSGVEFGISDQIKIGDNTYNNIGEYVAGVLASVAGQVTSAAITLELGANADTEDAVSNLQKVLTKLDEIEEKKTKNIIIGARTSTAYNNLLSIKKILDSIPTSKNTTVTTTYTTVGTPPSGEGTGGGGEQKPGVENLSANAKGNVALARGTLMGELGPELYVQNGSYHIAGSNGPEFVDLADDAIVFNHLQTKRILNTGHSFGRGTPVTNERRAVAWATGNVTGPALAGGIDSAIEQLKTAREFWKGLLNQLSLSELMSGSGGHKGGGSGNSIKAVTEELQEWYNLSRQIADIEQDINNLLAERENIEWSNGEAYLKSLREQQKLLNQQMATQQALLDYQELQLQRQADHINQNRIWSQFLTVGEDGLLQYIEGNETNGGKGALQVLQELNQMSGEEQTAYLKRIGYSYTNNDGEKLEGQELVEQFFQELQDQIDQYDSLYDTVHETEETLENLRTEIEDINEQIKENQMDLEEAIFDIIVEAWEKQIEEMEEQADLIKEANEAYINGLNDALSAERQMYDDNQKTADREQLQRQLSLLRRSGGSASEIADLEEQLNDMLKDEYFNNQERMIEDIQQANDIQVQQLETQIRLQEEALEYQKENGVIWTQVYEVLSKSRDDILAFMQGNSTEFFSQSLLQQEQMLTEWAHKIGIYKEDQKYQNYANHGRETLWDNGQAWNLGDMSKYQSTYNNLTEEEKNTIRDQFTSVYANARLDGKSHEEAAALAAAEVSKTLKRKKDAADAENNTPPTTNPNPQNPGGGDSGDGGDSGGGSSGGNSGSSGSTSSKVKITVTAGDGHGSPMPQSATVSAKSTFTVQPNPDGGYEFSHITYNGKTKYSTSIIPTGQVSSIAIKVFYKQTSSGSGSTSSSGSSSGSSNSSSSGENWGYQLTSYGKKYGDPVTGFSTRAEAQSKAAAAVRSVPGGKYTTKRYLEGGLVDYTGLAFVDGSKSKPEGFLNAEQTAQIREGLETTSGKSSVLEGVKDTLLKLNSSIQSLTNITNKTESNTYTIAPGAVVIQVEQLNDAYDVDTLSADIMNRMYAIGNKSTNRGVSRR